MENQSVSNNVKNNEDLKFYPKISVIIPAYNIEDYIGECLDSIVTQTYRNLEIIVVNDGSNDNTLKIIEKYASKDNRIIVINKLNGGLSSARNAGLDIMSGDYVSFIDGDDFIDKDLYQVLVPFFNKYPDTDMIQFGYQNYYGGDLIKERNLKVNFFSGYSSLYRCISGVTFQGVVWNKLYKRNLLENIRFFEGKFYEDGAFTLETLFYVKESIVVENEFYRYRKNRLGAISHKLTNTVFDEWDIIDSLKEKYRENPHLINCINNYSVEHTMYLFVDILNRGGDNKKEMLEKTINYCKKLRSTKLLCPFGIKYIRYKIFLWFPNLFLFMNRILRILKNNR